jgi:hypothetical protein
MKTESSNPTIDNSGDEFKIDHPQKPEFLLEYAPTGLAGTTCQKSRLEML